MLGILMRTDIQVQQDIEDELKCDSTINDAEIHVDISELDARTDEELTQVALKVWEWNDWVPRGLHLRVENGWITLRGHVDWEFQRNVAEDSLASLMGVRGIDNLISLGDGPNLFVTDDFWGRVPSQIAT